LIFLPNGPIGHRLSSLPLLQIELSILNGNGSEKHINEQRSGLLWKRWAWYMN